MVPVNVTLPPLRTSLPIDTAGGVVSSVRLREAVPVLPAASVSLATMVWAPSARPVGVNVHAPLASAVAVVATAWPSTVKWTIALASPEPLSAALEVILSVEDDPVSFDKFAVTPGATVSTWTVKAAEAALVSPCESVAVALKL